MVEPAAVYFKARDAGIGKSLLTLAPPVT